MRTGIYVYANATLTITASEPLVLTSYAHQDTTITTPTSWTGTATPGIYKVVSNGAVTVTSSGPGAVDVVAEPNDKDPWPEPPPHALTEFSVAAADVESFFVIPNAKSIAF